jgi:CDP-paratose 2-epimerase
MFKYKNILVTGGAGFVGSNICVKLKERFTNITVTAFDNLSRKGSESNLKELKKCGVTFVKGDVRKQTDLTFPKIDLLIECSAEPSVLAGVSGSPEYVINTNLGGAIHCFELARKTKADVVFLSTSRVYPIEKLNDIQTKEEITRFTLSKKQTIEGVSEKGISEHFPVDGVRSMYGATKLSAELLLQEYVAAYDIRAIIDRCGLLAGPRQMGKANQGVIVHWLASHVYKKSLSYIGFDGEGKQVRDVLHIDDLFELFLLQLQDISSYSGSVFNVGGGLGNSISLQELTILCQAISGNTVHITPVMNNRMNDVKLYITDNTKITKVSGWKPKKNVRMTLEDIYMWLSVNKQSLQKIFME